MHAKDKKYSKLLTSEKTAKLEKLQKKLGQNRRIAVFSKYKIFTFINIEKLYYRPDIHCRPIDLYYTDALTVVLY